MADDVSQDIRDRTFRLACAVARLVMHLPSTVATHRIADQLLRCGTSVGANLEEAKAASSRREFIYCVQISLKESRETVYWLRICSELRLVPPESRTPLIEEAPQVSRIIGAIVVSSKRRIAARYALFAFCILNLALTASG